MSELISVIIPVYNVEDYLVDCLSSMASQTYKHFEVICIDDGSTDNSANIAKQFTLQDERFSYAYQSNAGQSSARNHGLSIAKGEFVAFIDSDDFVDKAFLQELRDAILSNDANIAMCDYNVYIEQFNQYKAIDTGPFTTQNIKDDPLLLTNTTSVCNKLFRRNIFETVRFINGVRFEDVTFCAQAIIVGSKLVKVNMPLYHYRVRHSENMSTMQIVDDRLFDIYTVLEYLDEWMMDDYHVELEFLYIKHLLVYATDRMMHHAKGIQNIVEMLAYIDSKFPTWRSNTYVQYQEEAFCEKFYLMTKNIKEIKKYYRILHRREFTFRLYQKIKNMFNK